MRGRGRGCRQREREREKEKDRKSGRKRESAHEKEGEKENKKELTRIVLPGVDEFTISVDLHRLTHGRGDKEANPQTKERDSDRRNRRNQCISQRTGLKRTRAHRARCSKITFSEIIVKMLAHGDLVFLHAESETCHKFAIHFIVFPRSRVLETVRCAILAHEDTQHAYMCAAFSACVRIRSNTQARTCAHKMVCT